ncbi:uncharacterized protein [Miscanthus floridulus]|uniref:uncharacterized protein n=1 Tax=Miscanthus floridulus TaxID=154761 RepID=UPI00345A5FD6
MCSFMDRNNLLIFNWNVRGLNDAAHREIVREAIASARPNIICLQETKINNITDALVIETVGQQADSYLQLGAQGTRGGLLLAWNKDLISITNAVIRNFTISASVQITSSSTPFLLTTCYGPVDEARKDDVLAELQEIRASVTQPWLVIGDFNLIHQASDKYNLNLNRRMMGKFRRILDNCELME